MSDQKYVFRAKDFYALLDKQKYRCALSGIELTPGNTTAAHVVPLRNGGKHELQNIYLIEERVALLKRNLDESEVLDLAKRIINWRSQKPKAGKTKSGKGR